MDNLFSSRKGFTKMTWILFLFFYLSALTVMFGFVGETYGSSSTFYNTTSQDLGDNFATSLVTGISIVPWWVNLFLIGIPFAFLVYIFVSNLIPTTNSGA